MIQNTAADIDSYIKDFPVATQVLLQQIRAAIRKAAPEAEEIISYAMPAYKLKGNLVYFAGYKNHIGFYPGADGIATFKKELAVYKNAKGSVQFPLDKPLPLELITRIVKFRTEQNLSKARKKIKPDKGLFSRIAAPARRALTNAGITSLQQLAGYTQTEILALHGMGPSSVPKLHKALQEANLDFKKN